MQFHTSRKRREVLELYGSTLLSTRAVAERTGVNKQTVYEWAKEAGILRTKNASRQYPPWMARRAIHLYAREELTTKAVAERLRVSPSTVKRWLHEAGVMRSVSAATSLAQTDWARVRQVGILRKQGKLYREIAEIADVPMGSIHHLLTLFERRFDSLN